MSVIIHYQLIYYYVTVIECVNAVVFTQLECEFSELTMRSLSTVRLLVADSFQF